MTRYLSSEVGPTSHRFVHVISTLGDPEGLGSRTLRVMNDSVMVKLVELSEKYKGSIVLPQGETGSNLRLGTVLGYGPGALDDDQIFQPTGVEVGEVVVFHRWNMEHKQGRKLGQFLGGGAALIKARDILLALPPGSEGTDLS